MHQRTTEYHRAAALIEGTSCLHFLTGTSPRQLELASCRRPAKVTLCLQRCLKSPVLSLTYLHVKAADPARSAGDRQKLKELASTSQARWLYSMGSSMGCTDPHLRGGSLCRRTVLTWPSVLYLSRTAAAQAGWLQQTDPFSKSFKQALEAPDLQVWRSRVAI